ncbi:MFS transporter, DHA1 family, inner membrane transport protein [Streptomyces sp. Ag82_O1-12]|uniref:MFS transporter n=1 Tax=unclassified Streptomyces TaxID=2593676 RepID=UPI000BC57D90|nr:MULTISPECIES: MFS transporter [unclassified Streptomyces]SMQ16817.1 MFS transporter, DHA1 family, inner membrane transport protein [Streptomyces sp. Ag82_O1-12]SOD45845.1 MFS transporter, DHA1 family, inner membrane transport protein [Streptomyces sp. Ag82_G6-1]
MPSGLIALALGGFGIGLTEFLIAGLLPQVASSFAVSEAAAGWLISGYALSVAVGAIALTAATARLPRKHILVGLVALFVIGNLLSAVAPNYQVMLLGRIVAALCHGSFFGIGSLVARSLVAPEKKSQAVAVMFAGLTVANVLGVPFGALVGERWGWRAAFWAVTAIGLLALAGIAALVPSRAGRVQPAAEAGQATGTGAERISPSGLAQQLRAFRSWQVWLTLVATALSYGGMFGAFSYIAYTFTEVSGFASEDVAWLLMVYGVGLVVGNLVGGRAADRDRDRALVLALLGLALTLALFGLLADSGTVSVVLVFLMGVTGFASVPGMITRVTDFAHGAALAASANVSASNVGNALGAWLGGVAISAGLGYTAPLYVGAGIVLMSVAVMVVAAQRARSSQAADRVPAR